MRKGAAVWKMRGEAKVDGAVAPRRSCSPPCRSGPHEAPGAAALGFVGCDEGGRPRRSSSGGGEGRACGGGGRPQRARPAAAIPEKEPNEPARQLLAVPARSRDRIDADGDRDVYQINLRFAGTLRVSLTASTTPIWCWRCGSPRRAHRGVGKGREVARVPDLFVQRGN